MVAEGEVGSSTVGTAPRPLRGVISVSSEAGLYVPTARIIIAVRVVGVGIAVRQIGGDVREKKMRREASSYLTSCGLALRRFLQ